MNRTRLLLSYLITPVCEVGYAKIYMTCSICTRDIIALNKDIIYSIIYERISGTNLQIMSTYERMMTQKTQVNIGVSCANCL